MEFPASAIFAFNANIDYVAKPSKSQMQRLKNELPTLFQQISECFSMDGQMEVKISKQECKILLSIFRPSRKIVGGQAGNAAQQASALGINCFLHSNFASRETLLLFDHPEKIFFAKNGRFFPAAKFESNMPSAYHFVIQSQHLSSRFIASFDPSPIRLDKGFSKAIAQIACSVPKAFVGGFHLLSNPHQISLLSSEMRRWKKANPKMKIFAELGHFQSRAIFHAMVKEIFPLTDMVGISNCELCFFEGGLEEAASKAKAVLFHSPKEQKVLPAKAADRFALDFARKCAYFKAKHCKFATFAQAVRQRIAFLDSPREIVGLGDAFSCAYFMAEKSIQEVF